MQSLVVSAPVSASGEADAGVAFHGEVIPPYVPRAASPEAVPTRVRSAASPVRTPWTAGLPAESAGAAEAVGRPEGARRRRNYLPVLYSFIFPGAGEISLGAYKRGALLVAAEAAAWTGYAVNRSRGLDSRRAFEAYADAHWNHDRWIREHIAAQQMGGNPDSVTFEELDAFGQSAAYSGWPGYHPYIGKEEEKENYYENIGKYDWFISGWEDWSLASKPMNTPMRDVYRAMRRTSNDQLDTANRFIYLSIAARAVSLVETFLLVKNRAEEEAAQAAAPPARSYHLTARSTGLYAGEVAFEFRFK